MLYTLMCLVVALENGCWPPCALYGSSEGLTWQHALGPLIEI